MSPLRREKRVMTEELVSSNLLYFQKIVWPRKTKPRKKGMTPSKKISRLLQDFPRVADIKLRLGLYSRYFRIVIQANITPSPTRSSLC